MVEKEGLSFLTSSTTQETYNLRAYLFFWIGQMLSHLASTIVQFVIILWIALETESSFFLGLAAFAGFAPFILVMPIAGVFVDRWSRKAVIISMDFLQAVTTAILFFLFWIEAVSIWHILLLSALRGVCQGFHMPATEAIVPLLVPPEKLSQMNGLNHLMWGLVGIIGPLIAALLLSFWEIPQILLLDPLTFLIALIPVLIIQIPTLMKDEVATKKPSFQKEFSEGIVFIKERPGLLSLLSVFTIVNLFSQPFYVLLPLFLMNVHSVGENELSGALALLLGVQQVGMLIGSIFMTTWKGFNRNVVGVTLGILFTYLCMLAIAITPPQSYALLIIGVVLWINGLTNPISNVSSQTIWQSVVPPDKMGRVMSVRTTIAWFVIPVGMLLSGILAEIIGITELFLACAILGLMSLVYTWFLTNFPNVEETLLPSEALALPSSPPVEGV
ncbi:MAG: MFS transporter [Promethearchaeota archaeon]